MSPGKHLAKSAYILDEQIYCIAAVLMGNIQMCTWTGAVEFKGTQPTDMSKGPGKFCGKAEKRICIAIYRNTCI